VQPLSSLIAVANALYEGPTPAGTALRRCEDLLAEANGSGEAGVLVFSAGLLAMQGRFDEARERIARARSRYRELGWRLHEEIDVAPVVTQLELLAGDAAAAAAVLRESCAALERANNVVHLSTQAAQLAHVLTVQGRTGEAERWLAIADESAAVVDISSRLWREIARAHVLLRRGEIERAHEHALEAVDVGRATDMPNYSAVTALTLAAVLERRRRREEAAAWIARAIELYEMKENVVGAGNARSLLDALLVA
jgi:tetratricopeptide (TPR) repeat protein